MPRLDHFGEDFDRDGDDDTWYDHVLAVAAFIVAGLVAVFIAAVVAVVAVTAYVAGSIFLHR